MTSRSASICLAVAASVVVMAFPSAPAQAKGDSIYGNKAVVLSATKLDKWSQGKTRHRRQTNSAEWRDIVARTKTRSQTRLIARVNQIVNEVRYVPDPRDQWKTPTEFIRRGGDCEDYAITKYLLLREHGIPSSKMQIAVLAEVPGSRAHAVLVVETPNGRVVLDNLRSQPYRLTSRTTKRLAYAVNESNWWVSYGSLAALRR